MSRIAKAIVALACFVPALSAGASQDRVHRGDLIEGGRLFTMHCAACHGETGTGEGAVRTTPRARDLTQPARLNLLSDRQVYDLVRQGGPSLGRSQVMPAFGGSLSTLELWSLVSFLRTRHLSITDFYPFAESYWGESYTIDEWGLERYQQVVGQPLPEGQRTYVVLGIYRGTQGPEGPRLIPNDPREIAKIQRRSKVGYIVFVPMTIPGIDGEHVLGVSMDNNGIVYDIKANTRDPALSERIERTLSEYVGEGRKGQREPFTARGPAAVLARAWTLTYFRAMEAVVMFDKAERDRHWADSAFGGEGDPEAHVEDGDFDVKQ
jgi:mono/diheme cytochrome c family protein